MMALKKEYKKFILIAVGLLFLSDNVLAQSDFEDDKLAPDQQEGRDVEDFLKNKIDQIKKELSERERFFEHTYFYYHEHLQSIRGKNLSRHPFFNHYGACLNEESEYCSMLSQVFVDALWDLDARWRQMRTSGVHYRRRPSKVSPGLIYVEYLFSHPEYIEKFGLAESLRIYLLALKNNVLDELPPELIDKYVDLIQSLDDKDDRKKNGDYLQALKAAFSAIIDGPLLIERGAEDLVDTALSLDHESIKMLKSALIPDYGKEYLKIDDKEIEEKNNKKFPLQELLHFEADFEKLEQERKDLIPDEKSDHEEFSKWQANDRLLKYQKTPRVFVLCRKNREIPCMMVMRNEQGVWAHQQKNKKSQKEIWQQKVMASSNKGWSFYKRLGHTPAGIYSIDGIMPFTNRQRLFGRFHRLIINYLPGNAADLTYYQKFIPNSFKDADWWKQAALAKVLGRNLMRIHGTGKRARTRTGYYPLVKTNGCIAEIEGTYFGKKQTGQKDLLEKLQEVSGAKSKEAIHALLYVVEIDDSDRPVNFSEVEKAILDQPVL